MKELQSLLERIGQKYIDHKRESHSKHIYFEDGLNVYYHIQTNKFEGGEWPTFTAVLVIRHEDFAIKTWGCTDEKQNKAVIKWFAEQEQRYDVARRLIENNTKAKYKKELGL